MPVNGLTVGIFLHLQSTTIDELLLYYLIKIHVMRINPELLRLTFETNRNIFRGIEICDNNRLLSIFKPSTRQGVSQKARVSKSFTMFNLKFVFIYRIVC